MQRGPTWQKAALVFKDEAVRISIHQVLAIVHASDRLSHDDPFLIHIHSILVTHANTAPLFFDARRARSLAMQHVTYMEKEVHDVLPDLLAIGDGRRCEGAVGRRSGGRCRDEALQQRLEEGRLSRQQGEGVRLAGMALGFDGLPVQGVLEVLLDVA